MNKKTLIFIIAILCFKQSYCDQSYEYNNFNNSQHSHSSHHHPHLSPEKQQILNNYQRRIDTLYSLENAPSYTYTGCLITAGASVIMFFYGMNKKQPSLQVGGILGGIASGMWSLIYSLGSGSNSHERSKEIAEILEKMEKLQK